jgi:hypothetical protein
MDTAPTLTISRDGQQYGPYTVEQANGYLQTGSLLPNDLAWDVQKAAWVPLGQIPGIRFAAPPPPPPAAMQVQTRKSRNVFLLVLMGIIWWLVFFVVPYLGICALAGAVAGEIHRDDPYEAGRKAGAMIGAIVILPIFFGAIGLSVWLTIIGKLPGTRK